MLKGVAPSSPRPARGCRSVFSPTATRDTAVLQFLLIFGVGLCSDLRPQGIREFSILEMQNLKNDCRSVFNPTATRDLTVLVEFDDFKKEM